MPTQITITAKEVRSCFGDVLEQAKFFHKSFLITKQKKATAVLLGFNDYQKMIDMMDTMAEQLDPEFQKSLIQSHEEWVKNDVGTEEEMHSILKQKMLYAEKNL